MGPFSLRAMQKEDATFLAEMSGTSVEVQSKWIEEMLGKKMFIGEFEGKAVSWGAIDEGNELRWVVTPDERKKGYGLLTGKELLRRAGGGCFARIRRDNAASIRIAEKLGICIRWI